MTAIENVCIPLDLARIKNTRERAKNLLRGAGLSDRLNHFPSELSGGEQQRVAIARALASKPRIILADEPTGNLDQATGFKVIDLLFNLAKEYESSLVIVTHSTTLAKKCDRVVELTNGVTVDK